MPETFYRKCNHFGWFHWTVLAKVLFWEPRRVFRRRQPMAVEDAQAFLMFDPISVAYPNLFFLDF